MNWTERKRRLLKKITIEEEKTEQGFVYFVFNNIPKAFKVRNEDIGKKVWIASYPKTSKAFLFKIEKDYYKIKFQKETPLFYVFKNEVVLHPEEWTKERFDEQ